MDPRWHDINHITFLIFALSTFVQRSESKTLMLGLVSDSDRTIHDINHVLEHGDDVR
jgi:hypothetical protein